MNSENFNSQYYKTQTYLDVIPYYDMLDVWKMKWQEEIKEVNTEFIQEMNKLYRCEVMFHHRFEHAGECDRYTKPRKNKYARINLSVGCRLINFIWHWKHIIFYSKSDEIIGYEFDNDVDVEGNLLFCHYGFKYDIERKFMKYLGKRYKIKFYRHKRNCEKQIYTLII